MKTYLKQMYPQLSLFKIIWDRFSYVNDELEREFKLNDLELNTIKNISDSELK